MNVVMGVVYDNGDQDMTINFDSEEEWFTFIRDSHRRFPSIYDEELLMLEVLIESIKQYVDTEER